MLAYNIYLQSDSGVSVKLIKLYYLYLYNFCLRVIKTSTGRCMKTINDQPTGLPKDNTFCKRYNMWFHSFNELVTLWQEWVNVLVCVFTTGVKMEYCDNSKVLWLFQRKKSRNWAFCEDCQYWCYSVHLVKMLVANRLCWV